MDIDLQRVFQALPFSCLILHVDPEFTIAEASDAYLAATGTSRDDLLGHAVCDIISDNPDDRFSQRSVRVRESLQAAIRTQTAQAMRIQRDDVPAGHGSFARKYWLTTNYPISNTEGNVSWILHRVQDITQMTEAAEVGADADTVMRPGDMRLDDRLLHFAGDLQQVSDLLLEEERRWLAAEAKATDTAEQLALAVEAAELGTFHCPMPLGKINMNATCKRQFFLPDDAEVDFSVFYSLLHPDDREPTRLAIEEAVFNAHPYDVEYRVVSRQGETRWVRAKGRAYYDAPGQPVRFDGITLDVSTQKEAEQVRVAMDQQKDEFLAMLGHELRNPLAPIRTAAEMMMKGELDAEQTAQTYAIIHRQAKHMTGLIDDLLDVSRVTRGLVSLEKAPILLESVLSDALEQTGPLISARGHALELRGSMGRLTVCGDQKRLVQVFANLLHNAAKYTPEGGRIVLETEKEGDHAMVRVCDNGVGIAKTLSPRIFDLFTQAIRTPDRGQGGLGIGLALVRSLVQLHDGRVSVRSDGPGHGATFEVCLPLHSAEVVQLPRPVSSARERGSALEVVVVDDNEDAAMMLAFAVECAGHHVCVEHDSHQALTTVIVDHALPVDVCLLDIGLPDIDGNEIARRLRAHPNTSGIALIAVTGYGQPEDIDTALQAGFDRCLVKPINIAELTAMLSDISHSKARGASLRASLTLGF